MSRFLAEMHQRMAAVEQERTAVEARERTVEVERSEREWERKYSTKMVEVEARGAIVGRVREARGGDHRRAEPEGSRKGGADPARVSGSRGVLEARAGEPVPLQQRGPLRRRSGN